MRCNEMTHASVKDTMGSHMAVGTYMHARWFQMQYAHTHGRDLSVRPSVLTISICMNCAPYIPVTHSIQGVIRDFFEDRTKKLSELNQELLSASLDLSIAMNKQPQPSTVCTIL